VVNKVFKFRIEYLTNQVYVYVDDIQIGMITHLEIISDADNVLPKVEVTFPNPHNVSSTMIRDSIITNVKLLSNLPNFSIKYE
jgi:hypothetical protein